MRAMGHTVTDKEMVEINRTIENDDNPPINFPYFLQLFAKCLHSGNMEDQLIYAFNVFDKREDGEIAKDELKAVIKNLGEKVTETEVNEILDQADLNKDGYIDYKEFVKVMMSK